MSVFLSSKLVKEFTESSSIQLILEGWKTMFVIIYVFICTHRTCHFSRSRCSQTYIVSIRWKVVLRNDALQGFIERVFDLLVQVDPLTPNINKIWSKQFYMFKKCSGYFGFTCCRQSGWQRCPLTSPGRRWWRGSPTRKGEPVRWTHIIFDTPSIPPSFIF